MRYDENEMLIEYSEMTAFNFNSKEYLEVKNDFKECRNFVFNFDWLTKNLIKRFMKIETA